MLKKYSPIILSKKKSAFIDLEKVPFFNPTNTSGGNGNKKLVDY